MKEIIANNYNHANQGLRVKYAKMREFQQEIPIQRIVTVIVSKIKMEILSSVDYGVRLPYHVRQQSLAIMAFHAKMVAHHKEKSANVYVFVLMVTVVIIVS